MYVTRRRNRVLRRTNPVPLDPAKSNPSKRHRERLNGELEHLASLLPFEDSVIAKLDKLSVLRLAVSYLRAKAHYRAISPVSQTYPALLGDAESSLKALPGFIMVIDPRGEVFHVSETVEQYLGFHQSDILHQTVLELVHSEDRESLAQQLNWAHLNMHDPSALNGQHLYRSFIVRFRCLLDNTSGFITMEISGHLKPLYGQKSMQGMALFAMCTPFGPVPVGDFNLDDITFRSKHKLDMTFVSVDPRGKGLLGDLDSKSTKIYDLLHPMDVNYFANSHTEMLKTGSSGLVAYRVLGKDGNWLWLQTSARVVYRNSKPDYLMCFHRNLTEEEGSNLIGKRNIEFTMPHLHNEPLLDDQGEYIEDSPRSSKIRKTKKTAMMTMDQTRRYDQTPSLTYDKDPYTQMYYPFQSFSNSGYYPGQYNQQLYDACLSNEHRYLPFDYMPYQQTSLQSASMLPMDSAERFQSAVAMMNQSVPSYNLSYTDSSYLPFTQHTETSNESSRHYSTAAISSPPTYQTVPTSLKPDGLDFNSNTLLPFTELAAPLPLSLNTQ